MNGLYKQECYIALGWKCLTNTPAYWAFSKVLNKIKFYLYGTWIATSKTVKLKVEDSAQTSFRLYPPDSKNCSSLDIYNFFIIDFDTFDSPSSVSYQFNHSTHG